MTAVARARAVVAVPARPAATLAVPGHDVGSPGRPRTLAGLSELETAVLEAVAYADVFDWPLTAPEVHGSLRLRATRRDVDEALLSPAIQRFIGRSAGCVTLAGRTGLVEERRRRAAISAALWPRAIRYGRLVAGLPFVRLVAVTGSLAVDAAGGDADVDLFVVTDDGRVWLTRALSMGVVRLAGLRGLRLCPNYLVAESALQIRDRSLFTAHELAQMVPVAPSPTYEELLRQNDWLLDFLPNSRPRPPATAQPPGRASSALRRLADRPLRSGLGDQFERWEMRRKVERLSRQATSAETRYDAACCKGHATEHGRRALTAFEARLRRLAEAA